MIFLLKSTCFGKRLVAEPVGVGVSAGRREFECRGLGLEGRDGLGDAAGDVVDEGIADALELGVDVLLAVGLARDDRHRQRLLQERENSIVL